MVSTDQKMNTMIDIAAVEKALRRAYQLGQTYWQQADSEYTSRHKKADATQAKFETLVQHTVNELVSQITESYYD